MVQAKLLDFALSNVLTDARVTIVGELVTQIAAALHSSLHVQALLRAPVLALGALVDVCARANTK